MATEQTLNASLLDDYNEVSEQTYQAILPALSSPNQHVREEALDTCKWILTMQKQVNRLKFALAEAKS